MDFLKGLKLVKQKEFGKALNIFLKLEKNSSKDPRVIFYLGLIYYELNSYEKSISYYNKFLKKEPNSIGTLHNLALVRQTIGDLEAAKDIYLRLIKINKSNIRAYYGLYMLNFDYLTEENFKNLLEINKNSKLNIYEKGIVNFLLSKKEKINKNYKRELDYLNKFHSSIFNSNYSYNMSSQFYYKKIIINHFKKIKIIREREVDLNQRQGCPIFIVGLPRSGSTLIESILTSSVEKINSFGESNVFNMSILDQIGKKIYKKKFNYNEFEYLVDLKTLNESVFNRYFKFDKNIKRKNYRFIDKSLENFFNIEMIINIFPNAKFLHTYRNPIDSVISIYQSMLPDLSWTHSIENILDYVDNYIKVLDHFKYTNPKSIMDINLEKFTKNSEESSREIFKFCNLTWSRDVFNFHKRNDLYSKTLSFTQIRSKVKKYNEKKYQPYFHLLNNYKNKYKWLNL